MSNTKPTTIPELFDVLMLRFDHTDTLLDVIATTVNRHEEILNEHSKILNQHSAILDQHSSMLNQHSAQFVSINKHLTAIDSKLDLHEELLDTLAEQSLHNMQVLDRLEPQVKVNGERLDYVELKVARLEFAK